MQENKSEVSGIGESPYRLNVKQSVKGQFTCEFTVRAESMEQMEERFKAMKEFALKQVDSLNVVV